MTDEEKLQLCLERDRLLCSPEFMRSPTMSKLLRFLVDYKLSEQDGPLTAYVIAVDALGREDGFDTQADSYPRVQIGRLRRMLDHYYLRASGENRLFIPFHHYEIIVGANEAGGSTEVHSKDVVGEDSKSCISSSEPIEKTDSFRGRKHSFGSVYFLAILAAAVTLVLGIAYYFQKPATDIATTISYPAVIVKESEYPVNAASRAKTESTRSYLVGKLEKFDQVRIFDEDANPGDRSQYLLESAVLDQAADGIQLRLVDSATREVIWSRRIDVATIKQLEQNLDRAAIDIAGPHGKIAQHELSKYRDEFTPGYPCLLQFHQYLRYRDEQILKPTLECMEASAGQFSNDSYLMSMLAIAQNISERFGDGFEIEGKGEDYALSATKLDFSSASATFAVAQSAFFDGDCRKGTAWGERAVKLNPLNSRIMGYLGIYMLACKDPEGEAYAARALEIDPNVDLAVVATLAIQKLRRGDAKAAQELASKYMASAAGGAPDLEISYILSTAMLGEKEKARQAWRRLANRSGLPETVPPGDVLDRWIGNPDLVRDLEADFEKAQLY